ncbi:hypothetical protein ACFOOJ_13995 [Sphingobium xenophagum]|nr:hypothetical protein [Sphingobium xenophagum]
MKPKSTVWKAGLILALPAILYAVMDDASPGNAAAAERNAAAHESLCSGQDKTSRAGGLVNIAPDGTGATTPLRDCIVFSGNRKAAQIGRTIEISDAAQGPSSSQGTSTADSGSYALSLVNIRPGWPKSALTGEADGMSIFVRQAKGDAAAMLANVGIRDGFAATLESHSFVANDQGQPVRGVRTQLGVVNPRDGGEYGLVLQASEGIGLSAGLRIASLNKANWKNYFELIDQDGNAALYVRADNGAMIGKDIAPTSDLKSRIGSPQSRYSDVYSQIVHLAPTNFADLPPCGSGEGAGSIAFVQDLRDKISAWGQMVKIGGGRYKSHVKCDGEKWMSF